MQNLRILIEKKSKPVFCAAPKKIQRMSAYSDVIGNLADNEQHGMQSFTGIISLNYLENIEKTWEDL